MSDSDDLKQQAALAALDHVKPGMKLGLGSGSTATFMVKARRARVILDIVGVPTSERTAVLARRGHPPLDARRRRIST